MWSRILEIFDPYEAMMAEKVKGEKGRMKEKIINWIKFAIFLWMLGVGFFATYALVWVGLGIPTGWWATFTVIALALASVYGFVKWMEV